MADCHRILGNLFWKFIRGSLKPVPKLCSDVWIVFASERCGIIGIAIGIGIGIGFEVGRSVSIPIANMSKFDSADKVSF